MRISPIQRRIAPRSEQELLARCQEIEGLSFSQLANLIDFPIPKQPAQRKGWAGQALELALGSDAGGKPMPDFTELGVELKTIPLNSRGTPAESTFITSISLLTIHEETWKTSQCYKKLKRILWLPVEGEKYIDYPVRRIGRGAIWSPSYEEEAVLSQDWQELTNYIALGRIAEINSSYGKYLQIRPKASNAKALCYCFDETGDKSLTLPRGFYLRAGFTGTLLKQFK